MDSRIDIVLKCVTLEQIHLKRLTGQFGCFPAPLLRQGLLLFTDVSSGFCWHRAPRRHACVQNLSTTAIHWILLYPVCSKTWRSFVFYIPSSKWGCSPSTAPLAKTELFGCEVEFLNFFFCSHLSNRNGIKQLQQQT